MKTGSRPNLERENPVICEKSGGDAVKLKTFLITASLWMGLVGLTACGGADVRTYQDPETALLFDSLHIKKNRLQPGRHGALLPRRAVQGQSHPLLRRKF